MHSKPYSKRELRALIRQTRLRELGHDSYSAYLKSSTWRNLKARYRASDLPQVCMCGSTKVDLHHTTYDRVGRERLDDLIPLCRACHTQAHILEAAGIIELDLKGFYYDPQRAADGQAYLAQLGAVWAEGDAARAARRKEFEDWCAAQNADRGRRRRVIWKLLQTDDDATRRAIAAVSETRRIEIKSARAQIALTRQARAQDQSRTARPEDLALRSFEP